MDKVNKSIIIKQNLDFLKDNKPEYSVLIDEYLLALQLSKIPEYEKFLKVYYPPEPNETIVSLGSSVTVNAKDEQYTVNILGLPQLITDLIEDSDNVSPVTAIAKAILGKKIGQTAIIASNHREIEIVKIDQNIITTELKKRLS